MDKIFNIVETSLNNQSVNTVNARDIHKYLNVGKDFSTWIKDRIDAFSFMENIDYLVLTPEMGNNQKGRPLKEYHVSLDMAKELSMVDRGEKGKQVRKYFLECERVAKKLTSEPVKLPTTYIEALKNLVQAEEAKAIMAIELEAAAPKIEFVDNYVEYEGSLCLRDGFKSIAKKPQIFTKQLIKDGVFYVNGNGQLCAKQAQIDAQHFKHKITDYGVQVRVTHKGLVYLTKKYK